MNHRNRIGLFMLSVFMQLPVKVLSSSVSLSVVGCVCTEYARVPILGFTLSLYFSDFMCIPSIFALRLIYRLILRVLELSEN